MSSRRARAALLVLGAALALGACRSDGGVGRRDSMRSMRWSLGVLEESHERDVDATTRNVEDLGAWFVDELDDPTYEMQRTLSLYLEGDAGR